MAGPGSNGRSANLTDRMVDIVMQGDLVTWSELAAGVGEPVTSKALLSASRSKAFKQRAIVATPKGKSDVPPPNALVFRTDALSDVVRSPTLWRLALRYLRAKSTHLHTASELKSVFKAARLKNAFGTALNAALRAKSLPPGVGAVLRRGHFYLLLQDDLLTPPLSPRRARLSARRRTDTESHRSALRRGLSTDKRIQPAAESFAEDFDRAFTRLDAETVTAKTSSNS